ncbi:glycosyltransferase [Ammonicoccus fulvus]|uniref:Glycosyltransferase n=1 Tax=Ammonicoccus fulvus TaxID=3138240 RepID=A0ABZ3FKD6_9ACTN
MSLALLLATELQVDVEAGHETFGISAAGPYVDRVQQLGVRHVPIRSLTRKWNLGSDLRAFVELVRTLRRLKLDVLHTHNPKTGVMGRIAGRLVGIPVVVNTCHGLWARPQDPRTKRVFVIGMEAFAARFSHFELFQNAQDAKTLQRFLKKDRWKVVGNGVDLTRFVPDPEGRARVRAELGVADDEILVGTIGRRVREKGLAEYAEAAAALGDRARFIWVGPEDDTESATTVPHQNAIQFVSERTDMPSVYAALDIFALATYREGFSRASMEAAACGKPMVLTDIRGCREIGTHEEHLLLVPPQDGPRLTDGIRRLLSDRGLRNRLGNAARDRAHQEFDQRKIAQTSLDTYRSIAESRGLQLDSAPGPERLRVLHVLPHDQNRGAQMYAGQLRDALRDDPKQEHLLVTLFASEPGAARADMKLEVPSGPSRRVLDPRAVHRLRQLIRCRRFDVIVAHGGEALKYAIPSAGQVPVVYYKLGLSSIELSRPFRRRLYTFLAQIAVEIVGVSQDVAAQVKTVFGVPQERVSVIPNGRDSMLYFPSHTHAEKTGTTLLWVGQLEKGKRPDLFIDTVRLLRERGVELDAFLVGDGPMRAQLATPAARAGVEMLGRRGDVPDLMRRTSALVLTSETDTEGMPGVLIEAALSGLPVVSTRAAGVGDVVIHGQTGLLVSDHPESLVKALSDLIADPVQQLNLADAALRRARAHFTIESTARRWRDLLTRLTERTGKAER